MINSRLLKEYASWIYCTNCNKTVAYLCYVTYDQFSFRYNCNCGYVHIEFEHDDEIIISDNSLCLTKNRLCCPNDNSPLFTIVEKNLKNYKYDILCRECNTKFTAGKE